jgi:hypothetical protein
MRSNSDTPLGIHIVGEANVKSTSVVDHNQIEKLASQATAVARKRAHLLLHDGPADPVQRLVEA